MKCHEIIYLPCITVTIDNRGKFLYGSKEAAVDSGREVDSHGFSRPHPGGTVGVGMVELMQVCASTRALGGAWQQYPRLGHMTCPCN
jgi:hypothetical protein